MRRKQWILLPIVTLAMAASITACQGKQEVQEGTQSEIASEAQASNLADTQAEDTTEPETVDISTNDYEVTGMKTFDTIEELTAVTDYSPLTLADTQGYEIDEILLDTGVTSITYSSEKGSTVVLHTGTIETVDTSSRAQLSSIVLSDKAVSLEENAASNQKSAWWSDDKCTYIIDTFNMEYADFKTLLESLVK